MKSMSLSLLVEYVKFLSRLTETYPHIDTIH